MPPPQVCPPSPRCRRAPRAGFTLIELLIVIVIIGIVMAIIFPALSGARNASRKAATKAMMSQIGVAAAKFEQDNRRAPGYFSAKQMGSQENVQQGLSSMNNVMLDLAGGIVSDEGTNIVQVGPLADTHTAVYVDLTKIGVVASGSNNKGYFTPDAKNFAPAGAAAKKFANNAGHLQLPDVLDSFGNPILAWAQAENPKTTDPFGAMYAQANVRPFVYWAQNAPFLQATRLGKSEQSQVDQETGSILGAPGGNGNPGIPASLAGLLGNPAYPVTGSNPLKPSTMRSPLVLHSAGSDGVFLGRTEQGGKRSGSPPELKYQTTEDAFNGFDDLIYSVGN